MKSKAGSYPTPIGWQPQAWQEALALAARLPRPVATAPEEAQPAARRARRPRRTPLRNKKGGRHGR